jgi:hypothetical protein
MCPGIRNTLISFTLDSLRLFCDRGTLRSERIFPVAGKMSFRSWFRRARDYISPIAVAGICILPPSFQHLARFLSFPSFFPARTLAVKQVREALIARRLETTAAWLARLGKSVDYSARQLPLALVWSTRIQCWPTYPFLRAMMVLSAPWNRPVCPRSPGGAPQLSVAVSLSKCHLDLT